MSPHQNVLGHGPSAALPCVCATAATAAHPWQTVPQLRPPIIRSCRQQTAHVHRKYHPARAGGIGDRVVAQWVADGDVAVDGQRHGDPD